MTPRIAAAEISHETNVFSSVATDFAAFEASGLHLGPAILPAKRGTNSAFGGFLTGAERHEFELIPLISVWATPSGIVTSDALSRLGGMLVDGLQRAMADGPLDGLLLALHGAMVSELDGDGDAWLLEQARETVGNEVPIVATLDLHANISPRMVAAADLLIGYDTYPHVDMAARAEEVCDLMVRLLRYELLPSVCLVKPPMLPTSQRMMTSAGPMVELMAMAHAAEKRGGVVNVTVAGGFPASDVPEAGLSVLVATNNDPDLAQEIASAIAERAFDLRHGFLGGVSSFDEAAAMIAARPRDATKPLVIVDIGDNPWTGGPGDSAELLRFLLEQKVANAALALIRDPAAVQICMKAGIASRVTINLGGKTDALHGEPIVVSGIVEGLFDGRYINAGPMMAGVEVNLGPLAVVSVGGIKVLITTRAETPIDLNVFRAHGIEPTALDLIALKGKGHFRAAFEPVADQVILVEGPGITGADLARLPFQQISRPIWPLDEDVNWLTADGKRVTSTRMERPLRGWRLPEDGQHSFSEQEIAPPGSK